MSLEMHDPTTNGTLKPYSLQHANSTTCISKSQPSGLNFSYKNIESETEVFTTVCELTKIRFQIEPNSFRTNICLKKMWRDLPYDLALLTTAVNGPNNKVAFW